VAKSKHVPKGGNFTVFTLHLFAVHLVTTVLDLLLLRPLRWSLDADLMYAFFKTYESQNPYGKSRTLFQKVFVYLRILHYGSCFYIDRVFLDLFLFDDRDDGHRHFEWLVSADVL
jgi:hypothetical protein